jgi:imidazole glycerol-phosphate synthase subunit HisH
MATVGIIDYGMGNLRSVEKGLQKVGVNAAICDKASSCEWYDGLVLPGVGAFKDAIDTLRRLEMDRAIEEYICTGRHLLGICLGMQLLMEYSEEYGRNEGLGLVPGGCLRLPETVKVPHMGWNVLNIERPNPLLDGLESGERFYFVHSYYCAPDEDKWTIGTTDYGLEFTCALGRENVWGLQFHPEKSSLLGLRILENFGRMVGAAS